MTSLVQFLPSVSRCALTLLGLVCCSVISLPNACAQGLIWSLPEKEGTWVRYEGTFTQVIQPIAAEDEEARVEWLRQITLKCLGEETAAYAKFDEEPKMVPCRWVEIKVVTGTESESGIEPGPAGEKIYKVLIPKEGVVGRLKDGTGIPVSFIPIAKGFAKIGEDDAEPIEGNVLRVFPNISLLRHYRALEPTIDEAGDPVDPEVGLESIMATQHKGLHQMENATNRWDHTAELWFSKQVPFGLARWSIQVTRETKLANKPRDQFKQVSETIVEMKAQEVGIDAKSELTVP